VLQISEGRLNVTLRSLHRLGRIEPVARTATKTGGWRLTSAP